ncbi:energy-coupling factor transporter transmembrane component T family protein [Lactococcus insecticola]|uniref:ABC transporter permease n=1 Tax=Pseudolactococcus insecticola TaxID=2709158 RepID=A0A6A0B9I1_9LACT|nr:energy-coupling factor transporter transmembrane component T [Lactococcus insecticola]GFH40477.1 ABC transporter permease [Lactococcus insecticola]
MKTLSLYQPGTTVVHKIDVLTKLFFVLTAVLTVYISSSFSVILGVLALCIILLLIGKILRRALPIVLVSAFVMLTILLIQGLFFQGNETLLIKLGFLHFYREGLLYAVRICLRILVIITAFSVFILTTNPATLVAELEKSGLSPRFGYVVLSVLQIIPQMSATLSRIMDAQKSRALELDGNFLTRVRAFIPLMVPVVMDSLTSTRERSLALEVRAFNSKKKKTYLYDEPKYRFNLVIRVVLVLALVAVIVGRLV